MAIDIQDFEAKIKKNNYIFYVMYVVILLFVILSSIIILYTVYVPENQIKSQPPENSEFEGAQTGVDLAINQVPRFPSFEMIFLIFIGFSLSYLSVSLKTKKMDAIISDFFNTYHISRLKSFSGQIQFDGLTINVDWNNKKRYFILSHNSKTLSFTKPKELYWKVLYWNYKLKGKEFLL